MPVIAYIYIASVLIAFLSSLNSFRLDFALHLKLFCCLLGLTLLVELLSCILLYRFHYSNTWLYNSFTLVEFSAYGYYYLLLIPEEKWRRFIRLFLVIFPIFWLITVFFVFRLNTWNSYVIIVGGFFSVLFAILYYYRIIAAAEILPLRNLPEFWIATGMLIFYLGALPYFGTLNFLVKYHLQVAKSLSTVLVVLDTLMYLLFSYGFLCRTINTKRS